MSEKIEIKYVAIDLLKPAEYNPRKASDKQAADLRKSIERFGLKDPIIVNSAKGRENIIVGGHFRCRVARQMGFSEVPVVYVDIADIEKEKELNIRLNRNLGDFDFDLLKGFPEAMLKDVGFDSSEIDKIFVDPAGDDDDVPDISKETFVRLGDIYQLGRHRVMCGDSTDAASVALLMDGQTATMAHTDPPYNVAYGTTKNPRHKLRSIANDALAPGEWDVFCQKVFAAIKQFCPGDLYIWGASAPEGMRMRLALVNMGAHWSATIIWKKDRLVLTPANYQRMYEPCFYGWFGKSSFVGDRRQVEVWEVDRPSRSDLHPTMKPIALCCKAIVNSSRRDDVVLDLFLGSGSTLIACEDVGRICYGMELEPLYVDAIIRRWEKHSGGKAVKL